MTDERLQQLMDEAKHSYRVPRDPPLDAMWGRIEREHFDAADGDEASRFRAPVYRAPHRWWRPLLGIAATLLIGVGIGRVTAPGDPVGDALPMVIDASASAAVAEPLQRATSEYLDETVSLLASLPRDARGSRQAGDVQFATQAALLLGTTRLLLDSPAASDPRMRDLLEDLELVLAQVARLRPAERAADLTFIAEAMEERDVVPRLRTVAASLSASGY